MDFSEFKIVPFITQTQIEQAVKRMAQNIKSHYGDRVFTAICVLRGSFMFYSDLIRELEGTNLQCDFLGISSYLGAQNTEDIRITLDLSYSINQKHVLVVEDIADTGLTLQFLSQWLEAKKPKSIKFATLLRKPGNAKVQYPIDFVGFDIPDEFVVGYGLDYQDQFRQLPYIAQLQNLI